MATTLSPSKQSTSYLNPVSMVQNLWQRRDLVIQFGKREIEGRYKGSTLGLLWSFITPLVQLLVYTFVFGVVLNARWPQTRTGGGGLAEFAVLAFCGLTAYNVFGECVGRAPALIIGVPSYVKKVVFPLEILPVAVLISALFHMMVSLIILLIASVVVGSGLHWTLVFLPLMLLPLIFLSLGLMWFIASLGVFIRDIGPTVALSMQVLFFLTPIFFPFEAIPEPFRSVIRLNPLASITENFRRIIIWGTTPSWPGYLLWLVATTFFMMLGYTWFMKTKKAFADVI